MEGSRWYKRFKRECGNISPHIRFKDIRGGFVRLYFKQAYLHEVYKEMPMKGYDIEEYNPRIENQSYFEEFEDHVDTVRQLKNFVEGYFDSIDTVKTRVYLMKHNEEYYKRAKRAYEEVVIK